MSFSGPNRFGTDGAPETDASLLDVDSSNVVRGHGPGYALFLTTDGPFRRRSILDSVPRVRTVSNDPPSVGVTPPAGPDPFADLGEAFGNITTPFSSTVVAVTQGVALSKTIVMWVGADDPSRTLSVSDTQGHTWTIHKLSTTDGYAAIVFAQIVTPLAMGTDTITLNWGVSTDCIVKTRVFAGLQPTMAGNGTSTGFSTTYSLGFTASAPGLALVTFEHPFDFSFSSFAIAGWDSAEVNDGTPDQCIHAYWKQVSAGSISLSKTIGASVTYLGAGLVLAYAS